MAQAFALEFVSPCVDSLTSGVLADYVWEKYVAGIEAYISSLEGFSSRLLAALNRHYSWLGISEAQISDVYNFVVGNGFWDALKSSEFLIAEGISHPRNLSGCNFLVSYEIQYLLNLNFCDGHTFTTLRVVCPLACECNSVMGVGCPSSCSGS